MVAFVVTAVCWITVAFVVCMLCVLVWWLWCYGVFVLFFWV